MKAIVSVIGKDKSGIISKISSKLSDLNINIEDISQTIMQTYFTMIMLVDMSNCAFTIGQVQEIMAEIGNVTGVEVRIQHEDIFNAMHKI